jgi:hypothetical protein
MMALQNWSSSVFSTPMRSLISVFIVPFGWLDEELVNV